MGAGADRGDPSRKAKPSTLADSAIFYPSEYNSRKHSHKHISGQNGACSSGEALAADGSSCFRVFLRLLGNTTDQVWRRQKNHQVGFMQGDVYISHVYFQAVHPELVHEERENVASCFVVLEEAERLITDPRFKFTGSSEERASCPG